MAVARFATPLALIGGALLGCAFSIEWAWPGAFVAVALLTLSLECEAHRARAAFHGALFGWAGYVGGFFWLQPALASFWGGQLALSWGVWLAWGGWVSLRFVLIAWGYRALRARSLGIVWSLTLPWLAVEWLYPSVFPFYLASPLIDQTLLVQAAALGGPILLSGWLCGVSALAASGLLQLARGSRVPRTEWIAVLFATVLLIGYGLGSTDWVARHVANAPGLTVGIVQANVDVMDKRAERALSHRRHLEQSAALLAESNVELLVWPETSFLHALPRELPTSGAAVLSDLQGPLLFGGIRKDARGRRFNSALLIEADATIRTAYDKRFLIPFAEFVPFGEQLPWWGKAAPTLSRFSSGTETTALALGDWRIATPICYETIRPGYVRRLVRSTGANLLVSLSNDGWFGDSPEPRIHLALARFRAIEHRRYLVRATNTGMSAIVDPLGRLLERTEVFEAATILHDVRMLDGWTLYGLLGDWPGYLSALGLLVLFVRRRPA
jgi:apolipoprotein N-acyltransferase